MQMNKLRISLMQKFENRNRFFISSYMYNVMMLKIIFTGILYFPALSFSGSFVQSESEYLMIEF